MANSEDIHAQAERVIETFINGNRADAAAEASKSPSLVALVILMLAEGHGAEEAASFRRALEHHEGRR